MGAGLAVCDVISERFRVGRGGAAKIPVVRESHYNRAKRERERASRYVRFALDDEEHQQGAPALTRSREGARVAGLGFRAGPELPQRPVCLATACRSF
jgi:hypothetical protein